MASNGLRGTIKESVANELTGSIPEEDANLFKFHGMYQQDDRDRREERAEKKLYMDQMVNSTASTSGGSGAAGNNIDDVEVTNKDLVSALRFGCNAVFLLRKNTVGH